MFTGIIEGVGVIRSIKHKGEGLQVEIECDFDLKKVNIGDSISVNGCCLTVTSRLGTRFWADVSKETIERTTYKFLGEGEPVNIEMAMELGGRFGGHIVQGHVDGVGEVVNINDDSDKVELVIKVPNGLEKYIVKKGSIAIDGVSLTVNHIKNSFFSVTIIPHTKVKTTFSKLYIGKLVNLEVDIIGKYVEKLTFLDSDELEKESKITEDFLRKHGFN